MGEPCLKTVVVTGVRGCVQKLVVVVLPLLVVIRGWAYEVTVMVIEIDILPGILNYCIRITSLRGITAGNTRSD